MNILSWLILIFIALSIADVVTTLKIFKLGGYERNKLINRVGVWVGSLTRAVITVKYLTVFAPPIGIWVLAHYGADRAAFITAVVVIGMLVAALINNFGVIVRLKADNG